jgi:fructose 1,6-bisphosphatase
MEEFQSARLYPEEMEYTTLEQVLKTLKKLFKPA